MHIESKKNPPEKRKKEKLPLDVAPPSKQSQVLEQVLAVEMEETNTKTEPEASSVHEDKMQSSTRGVCGSDALIPPPFSMTTPRALKASNAMDCVSLFLFQLLNLAHVLPSVSRLVQMCLL